MTCALLAEKSYIQSLQMNTFFTLRSAASRYRYENRFKRNNGLLLLLSVITVIRTRYLPIGCKRLPVKEVELSAMLSVHRRTNSNKYEAPYICRRSASVIYDCECINRAVCKHPFTPPLYPPG